MIRFLASVFLFLLLAMIEFAFIHALPEPLSFAPLLFACGIYLYQHLGSPIGAWWIFALGVFTDFWHLGLVPLETLIYAFAAFVMLFLGMRLFTNRSLYGVVGNAVLTLFFVHLIHAIWFLIQSFLEPLPIPWADFVRFVFWQILFLVIIISILFFLARRIRSFLKKILIMPVREGL